MLSFNCEKCDIFWTPTKIKTTVASPEKAPSKRCPDCSSFDWPVYSKSMAYAKSLHLPTQEKKRDRIAREKAEKEAAANPVEDNTSNDRSGYNG